MSFAIELLLLQAAKMEASDLHISDRGPVVVRINGFLSKLEGALTEKIRSRSFVQNADWDSRETDSSSYYAVEE